MNEWMSQYGMYLFLAVFAGWMLWQRWLGPRLAGVRSLDAAGFLRLRDREPVVLDVRSAGEWAGGHPRDALLISLHELGSRLSEIPRDRPVVCICASGMRSAQAARMLAKHGCAEVYNFSGGFGAWAQAGLPVARGR